MRKKLNTHTIGNATGFNGQALDATSQQAHPGRRSWINGLLASVCLLMFGSGHVQAFPDETTPAIKAALDIAAPYEDKDYEFRADTWEKEITPQKGKAVRIYLYKGSEYCFSIHTTPGSKAKVFANVIDENGKALEDKNQVSSDRSGVVLLYKARKTGAYMVLIRLEDNASSTAMLVGSK